MEANQEIAGLGCKLGKNFTYTIGFEIKEVQGVQGGKKVEPVFVATQPLATNVDLRQQ